VQTRVFFCPRSQPNTIATAFAGFALLDAYELAGASGALELAAGVGKFFIRHVPRTDTGDGAYFGYLPGDWTPIHNANMLVAALLARLASLLDRPELGRVASAALLYTTKRQRSDGSWLYGEFPHLGWIDGFHTGYVLDCLLTCLKAGIADGGAEAAWRRGIHFYASALIESDGTPRYTPGSRNPVDGQCAAQAMQTLARATRREPDLGARRWDVLRYSLAKLARGDGAFVFQRGRLWTNRSAHPRWVQAPMLLAFTHLISEESRSR
jgi:polysaccharide biosynthesis protein VpsJ